MKKSDIILRYLRSQDFTVWSNWIWSHSSSLTFYWLIPRLQLHLSSSGNDKEVLLWTVTVSDNISCVRRKFDRLIYKLTTVTKYTRLTRFVLRVLYCQKLYRSIVWLSVICTVYNRQQKVQFSRISCVVSAIVSNIASVKTPPERLQIHLYCLIVSSIDT